MKGRASAIGVAIGWAAVCTAVIAAAQPRTGQADGAKVVAQSGRSREIAASDPPPKVTLDVDAPSVRGTWTMRVTNGDDVPVRVVADARLLAFDVSPRGARQAVRCELPADMKPENDLERPLVLLPHRTYVESFEPRLYCLGTAKLRALSPGAIVVAHLGWQGRRTTFLEVSAIDGIEPKVGPLPSIDAPPIALPDERTPPPTPAASDALSDPARLSLHAADSVDAASTSQIEIPITLRNDGTRAVVVRFRPETLRFDVTMQARTEHCVWPALPGAPMRDQFATVPPKGSASLRVTLQSYCNTSTFDDPGLYVVVAHLDTRAASGSSLGLRTFDGEVTATSPTVVRLHRGLAPNPLPRPTSEAAR